MKFKLLSGDVNWKDYGGKFVSKRLNNGEFDYWLVLDVVNMHEATGDETLDKYHIAIQAVSPQAAGENNVNKAVSSAGFSDEALESEWAQSDLFKVECLSEYGIFAVLWQASGNNINALLKQARKESAIIESMFGFYMDRPKNRIGQNGWQLIAGQDVQDYLKSL